MSFCTHCGSSLPTGAQFCGDCGSATVRGSRTAETLPAALEQMVPAGAPEPAGTVQSGLLNKYGRKKVGIAAAVAAVICAAFYIMSPKQLNEQEYSRLAIDLIVKGKIAQDEFRDTVDDSGVHIGLEPDWLEEYKKLQGPAKELVKDYEEIVEELEDVKPPETFKYEHENLLKAFSAHGNMASNIRSYMATGDEEYMELTDEYEDKADEYLEGSIFVTDRYQEKIMDRYRAIGEN
ncbi:zinc ribbon domain-containing protein [Peribacillus sp. SCS-37]|uniref:zinc ribbon domain-containing protein n=1 Tax=Paraperibacillus esterisolvens TaxID=3115296 RepID=UPI003906189F